LTKGPKRRGKKTWQKGDGSRVIKASKVKPGATWAGEGSKQGKGKAGLVKKKSNPGGTGRIFPGKIVSIKKWKGSCNEKLERGVSKGGGRGGLGTADVQKGNSTLLSTKKTRGNRTPGKGGNEQN